MTARFSEVLEFSWRRTVSILFVPFDVRRCFFVMLIVLLAGYINVNISLQIPDLTGIADIRERLGDGEDVKEVSGSAGDEDPRTRRALADIFGQKWILAAGFFVVAVFAVIFIGAAWVHARFEFIFRDMLLSAIPAIRGPWKSFRKQGNVYFVWNVIFFGVSFAYIILLAISLAVELKSKCATWHGAGIKYFEIFSLALPYIAVGFLFLLILAAIRFIVTNIIIPLLYVHKCSFPEGIEEAFVVIGQNKKDFLVYFLIKILLFVTGSIILAIPAIFVAIMYFLSCLIFSGINVLVWLAPWLGLKMAVLLGTACLWIWLTAGFLAFICVLRIPLVIFLSVFNFRFLESLSLKPMVFGWQRPPGTASLKG